MRLRQDRELDEGIIVHRSIHQGESSRINHVFRIVDHDKAKRFTGLLLYGDNRAVDGIKTIRFGCGTVDIIHDDPEPSVVRSSLFHGVDRGLIVAIASNEQAQIFLRPHLERVSHRVADNICFVPSGYDDSGAASQWSFRDFFTVDCRRPPFAGKTKANPCKVDCEFVERSQQQKNSRKEQQFVLRVRKPSGECVTHA
ncbi:hypothetical protein AAW00_13445 [Aurantiacibacter luteus]|uniref:Uncharacterized protein n=1 Tax=Aurantiacibacter luteus TaxID=1581420 RepID=A0A0G9MPB2_9SPHN|nr:hypothetical protein AAW00_13445 [Aurantiacibacter luteus]